MNKIITILFVLFFISCKQHNIKRKCCDSPPIKETFSGGYLGIPNIFTPNGDGMNDMLIVLHKGLATFKLTISNWVGTKIFETTDPDKFWDGTYKGKVDFGAFKFKLEVITISGEKISQEGRICVFDDSGSRACKSCKCIADADKCVFGDQFDTSATPYNSIERTEQLKCK